jgi:hypothetical protein
VSLTAIVKGEEELGLQRFCTGCRSWWPLDAEFWVMRPQTDGWVSKLCKLCYDQQVHDRRTRHQRLVHVAARANGHDGTGRKRPIVHVREALIDAAITWMEDATPEAGAKLREAVQQLLDTKPVRKGTLRPEW